MRQTSLCHINCACRWRTIGRRISDERAVANRYTSCGRGTEGKRATMERLGVQPQVDCFIGELGPVLDSQPGYFGQG